MSKSHQHQVIVGVKSHTNITVQEIPKIAMHSAGWGCNDVT